ncbi:dihydroorotase [Methanobrevibacter sp. UBA417]|jgi:dihydroorotase|uniref:dihydroorotase n=1 Tax=Methanobrevibacter sp. UBA417 TaxID=1915487 RepID=UPI0039B9297B
MLFDTVLRNVKIVNMKGEYNIGINEGKISKISKTGLNGENVISPGEGEVVLPGLIDPHVHFRDPGLTYKEDFHTGSMSAANGGFTTVIDMPNTKPITNTYKNFHEKIKIGEKKSIVNFGLNSGFNTYGEMCKIAELKPASFKIFMDLETDSSLNEKFKDLQRLNTELGTSFLVSCHCENRFIVHENTYYQKSKKENQSIDYSYARPSEAEIVSIKQVLDLIRKYDLKAHICHLSTVKGLKEVLKSPCDVSYEFTPHHIYLDNTYFNSLGNMVKTNPPLRNVNDKIGLKNINPKCMIGTDHAPHTINEKNLGVWDSKPGIGNLECVLPLLLTEVNNGSLSLGLLAKIMSENPAKRFHLENKGEICEGYDADITIVNLKESGVINPMEFYSKAKYSPFKNWTYTGKPVMTIVNGEVIMEKGEILKRDIDRKGEKISKYVHS